MKAYNMLFVKQQQDRLIYVFQQQQIWNKNVC